MKNNQRRSASNRNNTIVTPAKSVENGIKILRSALKKKISVSQASRENGKGKNYVSAIKLKIDKNRQSKAISKDLHTEFKKLYSQYSNA